MTGGFLMPQTEFATRNAVLLFIAFFALGILCLGMAHDHIPGLNFRWMAHIGTLLLLLSGTMLMWRSEHEA
jgi:isoprenylcysteine carboxyl methyltransferase (ICMT) family protein YpbQ